MTSTAKEMSFPGGASTAQPATSILATAAPEHFSVAVETVRAAELVHDVEAMKEEIEGLKGRRLDTFMTLDDFERELDD
jgi:hypothetical protein